MSSPNPWEPESFHKSYSSGVLPDKIPTLQFLSKQEVNEMICIKEVGVDLELCVHAHENDVDRLGSFLQNDYPAVWFFQYSWNWFLIVMVPTMLSWSDISDGNSFQCLVYFWQGWSIYCHRSMTQFYVYHVLPSGITPWYLKDVLPLHHILLTLLK